ncbi:MAG: hypothetical protein ACE369_14150 [Roseovarius sp.]
MRHTAFFAPRRPGPPSRWRSALLLALGLAILSGLALSGATGTDAPARQGFSPADQSPSFMPETVRLRKPE